MGQSLFSKKNMVLQNFLSKKQIKRQGDKTSGMKRLTLYYETQSSTFIDGTMENTGTEQQL